MVVGNYTYFMGIKTICQMNRLMGLFLRLTQTRRINNVA